MKGLLKNWGRHALLGPAEAAACSKEQLHGNQCSLDSIHSFSPACMRGTAQGTQKATWL